MKPNLLRYPPFLEEKKNQTENILLWNISNRMPCLPQHFKLMQYWNDFFFSKIYPYNAPDLSAGISHLQFINLKVKGNANLSLKWVHFHRSYDNGYLPMGKWKNVYCFFWGWTETCRVGKVKSNCLQAKYKQLIICLIMTKKKIKSAGIFYVCLFVCF